VKILRSILLCFLLSANAFALDICDEVANAVRSGDSRQISVYFGNNVDLTIVNQEDVYSRAQAELIIKDFLTKNPPKTFTIVHKGSSREGTLYAIGNMATVHGKTYRVSFFVKMASGKYLVQELRFENE